MGAIGFLSVGAGLGWGGRPPYTQYTYAQAVGNTDNSILRVAWYETYNGTVQETQGSTTSAGVNVTLDPDQSPAYVADAPGPVIVLPDVMPGDSGALYVGLEAVELSTQVWVRLTPLVTDENGLREPELSVGDTAAEGELQDAVRVRIFEDVGVAGIGACDGRFIGEPTLTGGSQFVPLTTAAADLADGVSLVDCLETGANYCLGFEWELPEGVGNDVQSDSVEFGLEFVGIPCGETCNPFTGDCSEVLE